MRASPDHSRVRRRIAQDYGRSGQSGAPAALRTGDLAPSSRSTSDRRKQFAFSWGLLRHESPGTRSAGRPGDPTEPARLARGPGIRSLKKAQRPVVLELLGQSMEATGRHPFYATAESLLADAAEQLFAACGHPMYRTETWDAAASSRIDRAATIGFACKDLRGALIIGTTERLLLKAPRTIKGGKRRSGRWSSCVNAPEAGLRQPARNMRRRGPAQRQAERRAVDGLGHRLRVVEAESVVCGVGQGDGGHARGSCPGIGLGVGGGGWGPRPWRAMTVAMLSAVRATSVTFMAPWQLGHTEMSTRKTRLSSHCHGWRPGFRVGASGSGGGAGR